MKYILYWQMDEAQVQIRQLTLFENRLVLSKYAKPLEVTETWVGKISFYSNISLHPKKWVGQISL
jgi:hypothetical protein